MSIEKFNKLHFNLLDRVKSLEENPGGLPESEVELLQEVRNSSEIGGIAHYEPDTDTICEWNSDEVYEFINQMNVKVGELGTLTPDNIEVKAKVSGFTGHKTQGTTSSWSNYNFKTASWEGEHNEVYSLTTWSLNRTRELGLVIVFSAPCVVYGMIYEETGIYFVYNGESSMYVTTDSYRCIDPDTQETLCEWHPNPEELGQVRTAVEIDRFSYISKEPVFNAGNHLNQEFALFCKVNSNKEICALHSYANSFGYGGDDYKILSNIFSDYPDNTYEVVFQKGSSNHYYNHPGKIGTYLVSREFIGYDPDYEYSEAYRTYNLNSICFGQLNKVSEKLYDVLELTDFLPDLYDAGQHFYQRASYLGTDNSLPIKNTDVASFKWLHIRKNAIDESVLMDICQELYRLNNSMQYYILWDNNYCYIEFAINGEDDFELNIWGSDETGAGVNDIVWTSADGFTEAWSYVPEYVYVGNDIAYEYDNAEGDDTIGYIYNRDVVGITNYFSSLDNIDADDIWVRGRDDWHKLAFADDDTDSVPQVITIIDPSGLASSLQWPENVNGKAVFDKCLREIQNGTYQLPIFQLYSSYFNRTEINNSTIYQISEDGPVLALEVNYSDIEGEPGEYVGYIEFIYHGNNSSPCHLDANGDFLSMGE